MSEQVKRIFGIDLGTTNSSIAYVDEFGKAVVLPNNENQRVTPSVVFFDGESIVVGDIAKESAKLYPNEVVSCVKRSLGEPDFLFQYGSDTYRAEEISSFILRKIAQDAEQKVGGKISEVVITCPAYFGINEREATRKAGEIAGLNVRQIINEPTAAAIAYGSAALTEKRVVLVYDLGGGTFDVTMINIQPESIEVICTGGDHNLGGKDWDDRIVGYLVQEFQNQMETDEDILEDPDTWQDLQIAAEKAKKVLTQRGKTPISITHGGERVKVELKREKFEEITRDLIERTVLLSHEMLKEAKKKGYQSFDEIILVGGSTRMPQVARRIQQEFSVDPKIYDPDEVVAKGAAIYGWKLSVNDELIRRIAQKTNQSVDQIGDDIDLYSEKVEAVAQEMADDTGYTLPAVQGSLVKIKDVSSKSFGVVVNNPEHEELVFNVLLRNTPVPADIKKRFYTAVKDQKTVLIRIMESETSEEKIPVENAVQIGTAILSLPPDLPADTPVLITFSLNREGRLVINAVESVESRKADVVIDTRAVIQGEALDEAKVRCQSLVVH